MVPTLYKLLLYQQGDFFLPHQDSEKQPGMFASLVITLPSQHEGGQLLVSHAGETQVYNFGESASLYDIQYAAFYADCEHEVKALTSGHRLSLIYNLSLELAGKQLDMGSADFSKQVDQIAKILEQNRHELHGM